MMWQCSDYRLHTTNVPWLLAISHPLSFSHHEVFLSSAHLSLDFLSLICWKKKKRCDSNLSITCRLPFSSVQQWASPVPDLLSIYYQLSTKKKICPTNLLSLSVLSFSISIHFSTHNPPDMTWVKEHCSWKSPTWQNIQSCWTQWVYTLCLMILKDVLLYLWIVVHHLYNRLHSVVECCCFFFPERVVKVLVFLLRAQSPEGCCGSVHWKPVVLFTAPGLEPKLKPQ